jgi:tRNA threonylcarbamoyladenosine biosynthesis protein TsaE
MEMVFTLSNIRETAEEFLRFYSSKKIFAFHGQLGSGKTTFIHYLCEQLHVKQVVGSPTFSIINEYSYPGGRVFHIDLFRLTDEEEAVRAGVEDCLYSGDYCFVEWPDKAPDIFPPETVHLFLFSPDPQTRQIKQDANAQWL